MAFLLGMFLLAGLIVFGVFVHAVTGGIDNGAAKQREKAMANADATYAQLFDGRPNVIFEASNATIAPELVMAAAGDRGYELQSLQDGNHPGFGDKTLVFRLRG